MMSIWKRASALQITIILTLALKLGGLWVIYTAFYKGQRPPMNAEIVIQKLFTKNQ
ncbi:hypothetical protein [Candidatus Nucleicultrix amoebiphila]|jgi:hypothetical protein|uniref:hypothetical protein n=1 Tax=Candidatus Nucleicultrix amoebiphila TaxID=1509244 RepID=UPI0012F47835|nr:hypothetical protein [Candidatus Nucleicultrix amoebiphila]